MRDVALWVFEVVLIQNSRQLLRDLLLFSELVVEVPPFVLLLGSHIRYHAFLEVLPLLHLKESFPQLVVWRVGLVEGPKLLKDLLIQLEEIMLIQNEHFHWNDAHHWETHGLFWKNSLVSETIASHELVNFEQLAFDSSLFIVVLLLRVLDHCVQTLLRHYFLWFEEVHFPDDLTTPRLDEEDRSRDVALSHHDGIWGILAVERFSWNINEHFFGDVLKNAEVLEVLYDSVNLIHLKPFYLSVVHWLVQHYQVCSLGRDDRGCSLGSVDERQLAEWVALLKLSNVLEIDIACDLTHHLHVDAHSSWEYYVEGISFVALLKYRLPHSVRLHSHEPTELSQLGSVLELLQKLDILRVRLSILQPASWSHRCRPQCAHWDSVLGFASGTPWDVIWAMRPFYSLPLFDYYNARTLPHSLII